MRDAPDFGRLDVVVNNAGLSTAKPALELTADDFDTTFQVDVRAAYITGTSILVDGALAQQVVNKPAGRLVGERPRTVPRQRPSGV